MFIYTRKYNNSHAIYAPKFVKNHPLYDTMPPHHLIPQQSLRSLWSRRVKQKTDTSGTVVILNAEIWWNGVKFIDLSLESITFEELTMCAAAIVTVQYFLLFHKTIVLHNTGVFCNFANDFGNEL